MPELTSEEKQKIYLEEKARLEAKEKLIAEKKKKNMKNMGIGCLVLIIVVVVIFVVLSRLPSEKGSNQKPQTTRTQLGFSVQHESEIQTALRGKGFPAPKSLEVNESGWLVATFVLSNPRSSAYLESFATDTLLTIRNTMYPHSVVSKYRVTLEGPSPGPNLVLLYGSARFLEDGGSVKWEPAKK